jgi:hypothetical protein
VRVALVLDTAAVAAFAGGKDLSVGEILGEIADEQALALVPVTALALAYADLGDATQQAMLTLLAERTPTVTVAELPANEARVVGAYAARLGGRLALAHAVREAERHGALLLSGEGDVVRTAFGEVHGIVDL